MGESIGERLPPLTKSDLPSRIFPVPGMPPGQIPNRAVENGSITRWGAIDDTEGGTTRRTNVALNYEQLLDEYSLMKHTLYYSAYDFELYSNFTFFLNDPENGDQIRQKENRQILGVRSEYHRDLYGNIQGHLKGRSEFEK